MTNMQAIPIKFTLMGVSSNVNDQILDFRDAMTKEFKSMLTLISSDVEGMKFTGVKERFLDDDYRSLRGLAAVERLAINFEYIEVDDDETQTLHLYYDIIAVLSDSGIVPGPAIVKAVRQNHLEIMQQIQEYKSDNYYYVDDFDLCTTSREEEKAASTDIDDSKFDLCTYDHQLVGIKCAALGLPSDMDEDIFSEELLETYGQILHDVDELVITGMYPVKQEQAGNAIDFYFDVNVLQRDNQNMKPVIMDKLQSDDALSQVLNRVQKYTDDEGRELHWCINDDGQYSTEPCVTVPSKRYDMPTWKISTIISVSVVIVFGLCIWIRIIVRKRAKESKEFKSNMRDCRRGRHYRQNERERKHKKRHLSHARYSRLRTHRDDRHYHRRHRNAYREATRHQRQYTGETLSDFDNDEPPRCLVLQVPLQHQRHQEKLRMEPWQQSKLPKMQQDAVDAEEGHRQRPFAMNTMQRSQPLAKQQHVLRTEHCYCDEEIVNQQDPLISLEKNIRR
ncbi:hypothetical protein HJC23_001442 [Cyclotella cryptica]|uniref:Uncharacterized protein n=1 Tax=Cyclotella cryptica TaxID=29204 RepID=A0ABD3NYX4_9STRA|eukprot:CCRYP_018668-RA/>CCRYP_018668-RA protein AED:0.17 eAED:0.17 QI:0/-1/0/1/-1/1/1/0/505